MLIGMIQETLHELPEIPDISAYLLRHLLLERGYFFEDFVDFSSNFFHSGLLRIEVLLQVFQLLKHGHVELLYVFLIPVFKLEIQTALGSLHHTVVANELQVDLEIEESLVYILVSSSRVWVSQLRQEGIKVNPKNIVNLTYILETLF